MVGKRGFTLIELLVVLAIVGALVGLAVPRYLHRVDLAKETVLRSDLAAMRDAVDKFFGDTGRYPTNLEELVARRYLRKIPPDPITERAIAGSSSHRPRRTSRVRRAVRSERRTMAAHTARCERGFTYLGILIAMAPSASRSPRPATSGTAAQREREAEPFSAATSSGPPS
jgi:type II secretion system protein G